MNSNRLTHEQSPVDRYKIFSLFQNACSTGQGGTSSGWGPVEIRSRSGRGPAEAQRSPAKHLMLMASQPVDPYLDRTNPQMASLVFLFYKKAPIFIVYRA